MSYIFEIKMKDLASSSFVKLLDLDQDFNKNLGKTNLSLDQMRKKVEDLKVIRNLTTDMKELGNANKSIDMLENKISKLSNYKSQGALEGRFDDMLTFAGGNLLGSAFSMASSKAIDLVGDIINVRGEFQKYEAVLTNALGSNSSAVRDLGMLQELATKTNFSMIELTDSYVKMINRGMKPTRTEMMQLADVANSTGKSYDQLVEAILDAQTGQFERLKEFGIIANKHGDQVKFTFKGVSTEVKYSAEAIGEYIKGLGKLEGVAGSTAAISKTLSGQISNLGDAWSNFLNNLGKSSDGVFSKTISGLTSIVEWMDNVSMRESDFHKKNYAQKINKYEQELTKNFELNAFSVEKLGVKKQKESAFDYYIAQSAKIKNELQRTQSEIRAVNSEIDNSFFTGDGQGRREKKKQLEVNEMFLKDKLQTLKDVYKSQSDKLNKSSSKKEASVNESSVVNAAERSKLSSGVEGARSNSRPTNIHINVEALAKGTTINAGGVERGIENFEKILSEKLLRVISGANQLSLG